MTKDQRIEYERGLAIGNALTDYARWMLAQRRSQEEMEQTLLQMFRLKLEMVKQEYGN
jgi:hypothetical protein